MHYQGKHFSLLFNFDHGNFKYKSDGAIEVKKLSLETCAVESLGYDLLMH